jgi:aminoglycoside/choline kinase family phosphotransferase
MSTDSRLEQLQAWITATQGWTQFTIKTASADASFRRYFRVTHQEQNYIAMDAPPEKEDIVPFLDVTQRLSATGVHVPAIYAKSTEHGFILLEDLGSTPYQAKLEQHADSLYQDAMRAMVQMQRADTEKLPPYNASRLLEEMQLMPEWFLKTHLQINLNDEQQSIIDDTFNALLIDIIQQPQGFVHRDYHSRNLMVTSTNNPGVIDYQDAVYGPFTYDLVSLLRDCYVCWSNQQVEGWALQYRDMAVNAELIQEVNDETFLRWFDLIGLQRHIKVLGIFARLNHRDGKSHYLCDLPLTLSYVMEVGKRHPETQALVQLFNELGIPETIGTVDIPA